MAHAFLLLASAEGGESSKAAFYILGGALAAFAVVLSVVGMRAADFPATPGAQRGLAAVTLLLVAGAMATAIITA
jgi:hypothetical protein